jgi:hypothetical protein
VQDIGHFDSFGENPVDHDIVWVGDDFANTRYAVLAE